ncbi:major facilitator superfamily domain-containing protein [Paraphoma chrysanthemicola]|uniref:Major facilitator superfamily domain-containing protein n=1 Tax=Paraphoma chrysanthemicola TaxID=798071 RepID=A0A8K0QSD6_9PLEO|nr:major facilitator superfamily domain-containing protein [Paraphoma chrysanthemicola]
MTIANTDQDPENIDSIANEQDNSNDTESTPLLKAPSAENWSPPRHFYLIELAIFANVFLYGFDGTITAATYAVISSDFDAANTASWLTTSYLVTSTAFQPLYGRFSDIFGRRICFFVSTITFAVGCLGCGLARNIVLLNVMRAVTGLGGGGLMTMATIVNSDMIPFKKRGMYQALQNSMFGFGAICGASFGGSIADNIGWRWCFLLQVPISVLALVVGYLVIHNPMELHPGNVTSWSTTRSKIDITGSLLLVTALSTQLTALSLGGNDLPWSSPLVLTPLILSIILIGIFLYIEATTRAIPIIPLSQLTGRNPVAVQIANICAGTAAYAYLFTLPLFFQVVLLDTPTRAGARLAIPSLATPIGGVIAGVVMSRWGKLLTLVRIGAVLMTAGNGLVTSLGFWDSEWKYLLYIFPANLGQGIVYPAILFTTLASFGHADHAVSSSTTYLLRTLGSVYGVALSSSILQTHLTTHLPLALAGTPHLDEIINSIRHSVTALRDLPPDVQLQARLVYYEGLRWAFGASTGIAGVGVLASLVVGEEGGLRDTH